VELVTYRLTFDTIDANQAGMLQYKFGEHCWNTVNYEYLNWITMYHVTHEYVEAVDQYKQLRSIELARSAPVRNVKLEKTVMPEPIWEEVKI
jgi:hypothetical protein